MPINNDFGQRVRDRRIELGISQDELAKRVGYSSRSSINKIEAGARNVTQTICKKLAHALGTTTSYLLGDTDDSSELSLPPGAFIPQMNRVPLLGSIQCGKPVYADVQYGDWAEMPDSIHADFALRAQGDSMTGARIYDGDIVFCRETSVVDNGRIAAVVIEDEATLKRVYLYRDKELLILKPDNPEYEDQIYSGEELDRIHIVGEAVAFQSLVR